MLRRVWWLVLALCRMPLELFRVLLLPTLPRQLQRMYWARGRAHVSSSPEHRLLGPGRAQSCEELAKIELADGKSDRALELYEEAIALRTSDPESPLSLSDSWLLMSYADALQKVGRSAEARAIWSQVAGFPAGTRRYQVHCQQMARANLAKLL
jgi:tetratricopeptide (TPR) repeat protein